MRKVVSTILILLLLSACTVTEVRVPATVIAKEKPPVEIPNNIVTVYCGEQVGTGFPIEQNRVVTAYHVLDEYTGVQSCSIMNYSAKLIYFDEMKDIAVLETVWEFSELFEFETDDEALPMIGANYRQGDSGMPLLSDKGKVVAMLIGQRADKTFAIVDVRYLRNLRRDQEKEEQKRLTEERLAREEAERLEAERLEKERLQRQYEWARQQEIQRQAEEQRKVEEQRKAEEKTTAPEASASSGSFKRES